MQPRSIARFHHLVKHICMKEWPQMFAPSLSINFFNFLAWTIGICNWILLISLSYYFKTTIKISGPLCFHSSELQATSGYKILVKCSSSNWYLMGKQQNNEEYFVLLSFKAWFHISKTKVYEIVLLSHFIMFQGLRQFFSPLFFTLLSTLQ